MIKCCGYVLEQLDSLVPEYTHLASTIEAHWGTSRCNDIFHQLMASDRTDRKELPMGVYTTLLTLFVVHVGEYGTYGNPMVFEHLNVDLDLLDKDQGGYLTDCEKAEMLMANSSHR
jgi:hypothetical protein